MKNAMCYRVNSIFQHRRMNGAFVDELKKLIVTDTVPKVTEYIKQSK